MAWHVGEAYSECQRVPSSAKEMAPGIFHFGRDEKTPFAISNKARERVAQGPRTVPLRWSVELVTTMGETATARAFGRLSVDASASGVAVSDGSELLSGCSGLARRERLAVASATRLVFLGWLLIKAPSREHPLKRPGTASPSPGGVAVSWPGQSRHLAWSSWQRLMLVLRDALAAQCVPAERNTNKRTSQPSSSLL